MNSMKKSNSIGYFDFARGIGIIIVVVGHSVSRLYPLMLSEKLFGNVFMVLGAGTMVMFFMLSGYGFVKRKNKKCFQMQSKLILKPYAITTCLILCAKLVLSVLKHRSFWEYGGEMLPSYLFAIVAPYGSSVLGIPVGNVAMLWFLIALFGGWCLYNVIQNFKNEKLTDVLMIVFALVAFGMSYYSSVWPFCLPMILFSCGFIHMGYTIQKKNLIEQKLAPYQYGILVVFSLITLAFGGCDIYTCQWKLWVFDYTGIVCIGFLLLRFYSWIAEKEIENKLYEIISIIGANTLVILCIHAFDEKILPWHKIPEMFGDRPLAGIMISILIRVIFIFVAFQIVKYVKSIMKKIMPKKKRKKKKIKLEIEK